MSWTRTRFLLVVLTVATPLFLAAGVSWADPITLVPGTANMFRDIRGANNVGVGSGDVVQYGANIQPSLGSTIEAFHTSGAVDPANPCAPLTVSPNFCANGFLFNATRLTGWTIRFTNGADTLDVPAPSLEGADPVPFPTNVTITAGRTPTTPRINWTIDFMPGAFRVSIFDRDSEPLPNGTQDVIHSAPIPASSTGYTIPATLSSGVSLQLERNYAINFQVIKLREGVTEEQFVSTNNNALILSRSNSWFNFSPVDGDVTEEVHLPQVGPDPDPNDNLGAPYQFTIGSVGPISITFIDPVVAVGYDYAIGPGNPNFASVLLPDVGDGVYDVIFAGVQQSVLAGEQFFFPPGGVAAFSVRGIETSARLDPANVTAFITGLTFATEGSFTGTMTPVTTVIPDSTPLDLVTELIDALQTLPLGPGVSASLGAKLGAARRALTSANVADDVVAPQVLRAFVEEVDARTGHGLTPEQAGLLRDAAMEIILALTD